MRESLQNLYTLGTIADVRSHTRRGADGLLLRLEIEPQRLLWDVEFTGNRPWKGSRLRDALSLREGMVLDERTAADQAERLRAALADDLHAPEVPEDGPSGWRDLPGYPAPQPLPEGVTALGNYVTVPTVLARRIAQIAPEFGADYGPAEVFSTDVNHDLLAGIDYRKGCFVGQEVASRMHRKGGVRKRSVPVEGTAPLTPGKLTSADGLPMGDLLRADETRGIAVIRVDRVAPGRMLMDSAGTPLTADLAQVIAEPAT